jgi:hypothetical protein
MRQGPNPKRSRGRNNTSNNNSNNGNNGRRPNMPLRMQTFDSNGPDVRIRGSAFQVHEKYLQLARDASSSGDRIIAESYLQHAEHYYRIIAAVQEQQQQQNANDPSRRYRPEGGYGQDYRGQPGEDSNGEGGEEFGDEANDAPQLRGDGSYRQQPEQQNRSQNDGQYRTSEGPNRSQNDRSQNDRSQNDRPQNDRSQNEGQYRQDRDAQYRGQGENAYRRDSEGRQDTEGSDQPRVNEPRGRQQFDERPQAVQQDRSPQQERSQQERPPQNERSLQQERQPRERDYNRSDRPNGRRQYANSRSETIGNSNGAQANEPLVNGGTAESSPAIVAPEEFVLVAQQPAEIIPQAAEVKLPARRGRPRRERPVEATPEPVAEGG